MLVTQILDWKTRQIIYFVSIYFFFYENVKSLI
jgi:hypothetical protein